MCDKCFGMQEDKSCSALAVDCPGYEACSFYQTDEQLKERLLHYVGVDSIEKAVKAYEKRFGTPLLGGKTRQARFPWTEELTAKVMAMRKAGATIAACADAAECSYTQMQNKIKSERVREEKECRKNAC